MFRFAEFELDEGRREIRLKGREIPVQPRVLDLLVYLLRNSDRVVSKDELLENLWPGSVVVDGALQRVVSLARAVLGQGGARDAIRTYARHGYRFCLESVVTSDWDATVDGALGGIEQARDAFQRMDWTSAAVSFAAADAKQALAAPDLERWAQALHWGGEGRAASEPLERAVAAHLSQGDRVGAARAALALAQIAFERMELAIATGWHRRAATYLRDVASSREHGLLHYLAARMALFDGDFRRALDEAQAAHRLGVELEDPDLEGLGLVYSGHALLGLGEVGEGVEAQNEAAASVLAGQVSSWAGALIYCGVVWACRNRADWDRAAQWTEQLTRWCEQRGMQAFPGTCRLHRAEVLGVCGEIEEALREISESTVMLSTWAPWAEGDAYRVLGDLRLGQGELAEAEEAYRRARELGWDPQPGYAILLLNQGEAEAAVSTLEASLADPGWVNRERRGMLLAHLLLASARAGRLERAREVLRELQAKPELCAAPAAEAMLLRGRAELAWAEGRGAEAVRNLRRAAARWQQVGSPLHAAHLRLRLAELLGGTSRAEADVELALAEAAFESHRAPKVLERCRRLRAAWAESAAPDRPD